MDYKKIRAFFEDWWRKEKICFHQSQFSDKEIAYAALLKGVKLQEKEMQATQLKPAVEEDIKLKLVIEWLEQNQPDVFRRGLWDAIRTA